MLDFVHSLKLRAVAAAPGDDHESPALDNLVSSGMVERRDGALVVTTVGHEVMKRSEPSRRERWALRVLAFAVTVLAVTTVIGWIT